jgi:DNA-binding NtrC family response regulator
MTSCTLVEKMETPKMKPNLPVIASTGQGEPLGVVEFQALGVKNFLTKPYNTGQLLETIHGVLEENA